tara:strand:+ start:3594 stop:4274 length:681 start_codon:yes stop_codon:yes gene_type:complete
MADFINDPNHYGTIAAYDEAKGQYAVYLLKECEKAEEQLQDVFTKTDFDRFKERLQGVDIVPATVTAGIDMEERTRLYQEHDAEKRTAIRKDSVNRRVKRARSWLETEYGARSTFLEPLDEKEMRMLCTKLRPMAAQRLAYGTAESLKDDCVLWQGGKNNGKPYMERRGRRKGPYGGPTKQRRVMGPTADMLYNYWRIPLRPGQRLGRCCDEPMCVNPYHYELVKK